MKPLLRVVATAGALAFAFPTAAVAQQATPSQGSELPAMRVEQLETMKVLNEKGEEIGKIKEIVRSKTNKDEIYVVVGVGGFLGIVGERDVTLPLRDMSKRANDLQAPAGTTKAQLEKLPKYDKDQFVQLPNDQVVTIGSHTHTGGRY